LLLMGVGIFSSSKCANDGFFHNSVSSLPICFDRHNTKSVVEKSAVLYNRTSSRGSRITSRRSKESDPTTEIRKSRRTILILGPSILGRSLSGLRKENERKCIPVYIHSTRSLDKSWLAAQEANEHSNFGSSAMNSQGETTVGQKFLHSRESSLSSTSLLGFRRESTLQKKRDNLLINRMLYDEDSTNSFCRF